MMLMFKFEKDMTLKSEAAAGLKQQTFLNCRQYVLLVLSCDVRIMYVYMYMCRCTHMHVHNSTCTGKSACAQGNYLRIWLLDRKMSSKNQRKKCPMCSFNTSTVKLVLSHLRSVHSSDPRFHVMCGIDGCARIYRKYSGLH